MLNKSPRPTNRRAAFGCWIAFAIAWLELIEIGILTTRLVFFRYSFGNFVNHLLLSLFFCPFMIAFSMFLGFGLFGSLLHHWQLRLRGVNTMATILSTSKSHDDEAPFYGYMSFRTPDGNEHFATLAVNDERTVALVIRYDPKNPRLVETVTKTPLILWPITFVVELIGWGFALGYVCVGIFFVYFLFATLFQ